MSEADPSTLEKADAETESKQSGESVPPPPPQPVQRQLGRYQLMLELASGGMATVYLARAAGAAGFEKLVALKRIHAHLAKQKKFTEMFLDEARIASRIGHPNVCDVFDFGEADGTYYLAMEYLLGETVSKLIRKRSRDSRPWSARELALVSRVVAEAAQGLHAAHELRDDRGEPMQLVHRDISPQNLFVTYDGAVKVVDFGIARARGRIHDTTTGSIKGKYAYMSPEQVRNLPLDRRTDVWALGTVLWELLTRKRLFRRDSEVDTLMAVNEEVLVAPSSVRSDVPAAFDAIVMGALCRNVEERTPTAKALGRQLIDLASSLGPPVTMDDLSEWMRELFAEEAARRREVVDFALQMGRAEVPRVSAAIFGREASDQSSVSVPSVTIATTDERVLRPSRAPTLVAIGATAALLIGGAVWWSTQRAEPEGTHAAAAPPAAVEPAPARREPDEPAMPGPGATSAAAETVHAAVIGEPEAAANGTGAPDVAPVAAEPRTKTRRVRPPRAPAEEQVASAEPDEAPTAPAQPAATGTVNVVTPGGWWADVFFQGRRLGRTPVRITLPAGPQTVTLRPFGEPPDRTVQVNVPANGNARLSVPREP